LAGGFADYSPMPTEPIIIVVSFYLASFSIARLSTAWLRF
jgi:hypothetical protein